MRTLPPVRICFLAAIGALAVPAASASAAIVTMNFQGAFQTVFGTPIPGVASGNTFSGSVVYDTAATGTPNAESAFFGTAMQSFTVTINTGGGPLNITSDILTGPYTQGFGGNGGIRVTENEPDIFNPGMFFDRFQGYAASTTSNVSLSFDFTVSGPLPGPITSLAIPGSINPADFNISRIFQITRSGPGFNLANGQITSATFIPAPSAACPLLACGLLAARRRR